MCVEWSIIAEKVFVEVLASDGNVARALIPEHIRISFPHKVQTNLKKNETICI